MAMGAIEERVDYEMGKIIDNIMDINTKASGKRSVNIKIDLIPTDDRRTIRVSATVKSTLVPTAAVETQLFITTGNNNETIVAEVVPQIPGQFALTGEEQPQPNILRFAREA